MLLELLFLFKKISRRMFWKKLISLPRRVQVATAR